MLTIAKQLYVTKKHQSNNNLDAGLLGCASPYTKDTAFEKRRATQESWAYGGRGFQFKIESDDTIVPLPTCSTDPTLLFSTNCYPVIIENTLIDGFQIAKSVRRYTNRGNSCQWRIADPNGFELEIDSENFNKVIDCSTIINGVIQGRCLWGRENGKNILLPEASDLYQNAVKITKQVNTKILLTDIAIGSEVELLATNISSEHEICQYLGFYYFLTPSAQGFTNKSETFIFNKHQNKLYLLKSKETGNYFAKKSLKVVNILTTPSIPLIKKDIAKEVNNWISKRNIIENSNSAVLISPLKINLSSIKMSLNKVVMDDDNNWPVIDNKFINVELSLIVKSDDGSIWLSCRTRTVTDYNHSFTSSLCKIQLSLIDNTITLLSDEKQCYKNFDIFWNSRLLRYKIVKKAELITNLDTNEIIITTDTGFVGTVVSLRDIYY